MNVKDQFGDRMKVKCPLCQKEREISTKTFCADPSYVEGRACRSCALKLSVSKRPLPVQCSSEYWASEKRLAHGETFKHNPDYLQSRQELKTRFSGSGNPRFGKEVSEETRRKMSESRRGKTGRNATAWKGGKDSLCNRLKSLQQTRFSWYSRVLERDKSKCVECGGDEKVEVHHIRPVSQLIRELLLDKEFDSETSALEWLITLDSFTSLDGGQSLCRVCHKKKHLRGWARGA